MNRPLRVLLVLGTSSGGVGRHVRDLARSLVDAGHQVIIAGPQSTQDTVDLTASGARFVAVPIADRPSLRGDPRSLRSLRRLIKGCDVVHAHGLRAGALAALARGRSGPPPLVVTVHNGLVSAGAVATVYRLLERVVARRADAVLAVSPDLEQRQRDLGARRVRAAVIAAPAAQELAGGDVDTEQVRRELGVARGTPLVVSVARLAEQKGLPLLLDAANHLRLEGVDVLIVVAGDGPSKDILQQRISGDDLPVRLLGWRADVPQLLRSADLVVSSATWEGQPIWLQEALLAGCPIVATDVGGTREVVRDAALLVPPGDGLALAAAISSVIGDDAVRRALVVAAQRRARQLPDQAATRDAALAVYADLRTARPDDC